MEENFLTKILEEENLINGIKPGIFSRKDDEGEGRVLKVEITKNKDIIVDCEVDQNLCLHRSKLKMCRFRTFIGGGLSQNVLKSLWILALAIKLDKEDPVSSYEQIRFDFQQKNSLQEIFKRIFEEDFVFPLEIDKEYSVCSEEGISLNILIQLGNSDTVIHLGYDQKKFKTDHQNSRVKNALIIVAKAIELDNEKVPW
ncbi:MAG TPA: hypothetical protein P5230_00885 [Candidatus Magasanikbacteria bacterium]|nr:hypothetical protein [Candidatus Magasanikbacteria bacterium]